ncbi:MAG: hypothetical protein V5A52_09075 [Halovenus sp.]|uniref:hypothetical protein n=1 Tax=Halovenus amylolytica TaxID=2500550 RepID=UPI000FE2C4E5
MATSADTADLFPETPAMDREQLLWVTAILFFGIGDLVTTSIGIQASHVSETGTLQEPLLRQFGLVSVPGLKLAVFAGFFACWRLIPRPHNLGVPLALTTVGALVTVWNAVVIVGPVL